MERPNTVNQGVLRLPPGFRFHPTDEELVVQYLRRKAFSCPLPASVIQDMDLTKLSPWDLPGGVVPERYFFSLREASKHRRMSRATESGFWRATGKDRVVVAKGNVVVGMKKSLLFYQGKPRSARRTDWVMHEYRLAEAGMKGSEQGGEWVLCRIFLRKREVKIEAEAVPECASSESSCVTEDDDGEEEEESSGSS